MRFGSSLVSILLATTTISITSKNVNNGRLLRISNAQNKERKEASKNIISCGSIDEKEYIPITDIKSINIENANQKVMISYDIKNDKEMVACTAMICPSSSSLNDKCCNTCSSTPKFDNINLIPSNAHLQMGCSGTNCDYMDNCIYNDGDKVLVYGTINSFGWSIIVDQHCIDPNYEKSQEEVVVEVKNNNDENIDTTHTITIIDDDLTAEKEDQYIMWKSYQNNNNKEVEVEEDKRCEELSNEFMLPGTVYCSRMLGIGIWNGECTYISGCNENGYEFFTTMSECKLTCGNSNIDINNIFDEREKDNNEEEEEEDILSPSISLGRPIVPKNYIPYEGITACITNNLDKSIFIPGRCSVFTLSSMDGNNTIVTEEDDEECYKGEKHIIQELRPKEEYCSNYYLHFHHESNNYTISAKYCTTIIEYDFLVNSLPFDETCFEVYTVETDGVEVTCPDMVDCMPFVPEALGEICSISGSRDLFIEECPNTLILN